MTVPESLEPIEVAGVADKKTSAPAKTAPRKPVSAAIEIDDDEDDRPKTKPGKGGASAKKPGIVGSTRKRRDDDDEDDDDDKPARKKSKSQGGSGAMIAIVAAGVVGLAALAGAGIWLLSGDKKTETATKSDSTNAPAPPAGPGGMVPGGSSGGPPGGMVPPGGPGGMSPGGPRPPGGPGGGGSSGGPPPLVPIQPNAGSGGSSGGPPGGMVPPGGGPGYTPGGMSPTPGGPKPPGAMIPPGGGSSAGPPPSLPGGPGSLPPGGGSSAGPPPSFPGGPPGGPMPPGVGSGPKPPSSPPWTGDGNRKYKIEGFYTAAFDTEKNEVVTIDERTVTVGTERVSKGWLRRYTYPDFKKVGTNYRLPQLASRAVIDGKAGLLYVATVTNPVAAQSKVTQYDNASASGDIAIYDLNALRDGKAADGKTLDEKTELKPVATLTIHHMIHAIELSADGKNLYVLTTSGTQKKVSHLVAFDTGERKEIDRKPLPEVAKDMVRAGDGKNLLIIGDLTKSKTASVLTFDIATMTALPSTAFQGAVLDVAPTTAGGAMVSVAPLNQPAAPPAGGGGIPGGGIVPPGGPGGFPGGGIVPPVGPGGFPGGGAPGKPSGPGGPGGGGIMPPGGPQAGGPGGGRPGGSGGNTAPQIQFKMFMLKGSTEMDLGVGSRSANGGYVEYDLDNKRLFVSSYRGSGLDVYEVTDADAANGLKLKSSIRTAAGEPVQGHFFVSPDSKMLVFHNGVVIDTDNVGGGTPGATNNGGGVPGFPGGMPPGGPGFPGGPPGFPGAPPGGLSPIPIGPGGPGGVPGMPPGGLSPAPGGVPPQKPPAGPGVPGMPPVPGGGPGGFPAPGGPGGAPGAAPPMPGAPSAPPSAPGSKPD